MPTCVRGLCSVTSAENCAESATTLNPQTTASAKSSQIGPPKSPPANREHRPLIPSAPPAMRALPQRSAQTPAIAQPMAPLPMATNATRDPVRSGATLAEVNHAAANAGIHAHTA